MVGLHSQAEADLRAFENRVLAWPHGAGGPHARRREPTTCCAASPRTSPRFQDFVLKDLTAAPNVASVKTSLAIRRAKLEGGVPVGLHEK